jgi:hypothetical protein
MTTIGGGGWGSRERLGIGVSVPRNNMISYCVAQLQLSRTQ